MIARTTFISVGLLAGFVVVSTGNSHASSHSAADKLRKNSAKIDMIVTGANNSAGAPEGLNSKNSKSECPLCFHRDLFKLQKGNLPVTQPFPGDQ